MDLSIIILNYNTSLLTLRCIETVRQQVHAASYELIVVDNHSCEAEFDMLKKGLESTDVLLVRTRINTGFGGGNMIGAHLVKGKYICFVNSDVEVAEDCFSPLCNYLESHSEVGCITPQQYNRYQKLVPSFNHAPGLRHEILGKKLLETLFPSAYPKRKGVLYREPFTVQQINGVFMLFPTELFFNIGGFDTNIFLFYEEIDVCKRIQKQGYKCVVMPHYRFLHLHGESTKQVKSLSQKELYISKLYVYNKHHSFVLYLLYKWINIFKLLMKPKRWYMLPALLQGEVLSHSMRHRVN